MKLRSTYILYPVIACLVSLLAACNDDLLLPQAGVPFEVEEGIPGELSLSVAADAFSKHVVSTREHTQQSAHSVYLFMVDYKETGAENSPILTRRFYPDFSEINVEEVTEGSQTFYVRKLKMPAISCNNALIFGIVNIGHSELQGVENDAELLKACNDARTLADLHQLCANLEGASATMTGKKQEVNVERMQGHHLMSGFYTSMLNRHFDKAEQVRLKLMAQNDGTIKVYDAITYQPLRPMGVAGAGDASALFAHRLDAKVTVRIIPEGSLKTTPGAYFKLTSWQVVHAPYNQHVFWQGANDNIRRIYGDSKVFKRDLTQIPDGGWTFSFYQFENFFQSAQQPDDEGYKDIGATEIANQFNLEYNGSKGKYLTSEKVEQAFFEGGILKYPNYVSDFAYTLRELENKKISTENGNEPIHTLYRPGDDYVPGNPDNDDDVIYVDNTGFKYAPKNSTYIRVTGEYYNPQEPVRRRPDKDEFPHISMVDYPYLDINQRPVRTEAEAVKRARIATVVYRIHLGYVGGGNAQLRGDDHAPAIQDFSDFKKKLNDYNVLRNNHYIYKLKIAGVNNIKLEATRENGGNILEQENQPGAEGLVTESQHFFELDSHYETRSFTIDFRRLPEDYTEGFSFGMVSPFDRHRGTLKKAPNGTMQIVDHEGKPLTTIKGRDLEWIHFAWHGTPEEPSRNLIDPRTGNGISYSHTYGGYENQQTYNNPNLTKKESPNNQYKLLDVLDFSHLVWTYFNKWIHDGKPAATQTMTFTVYVDEYYYDYNPTNRAQVNWTDFCNKSRRKAVFFMEKEETSADQQSWYSDAHLVIYQNSIQTLYATETARGQQVADVAFGIEGLDEFRAKYRCNGVKYDLYNQRTAGHGFVGPSKTNGLYNTMCWFRGDDALCKKIKWEEAEKYFNAKERMRPLIQTDYDWTDRQTDRDNRRGQWAVYSRNRDLNRNGELDADEVRWFVPAIDQYTLCFLGGRPVFRNPLFERDNAVVLAPTNNSEGTWTKGFPVLHYMSNTDINLNRVFWSEEGCAKSNYAQGQLHGLYGIRMARMLTKSERVNTGQAFVNNMNEQNLAQDELFLVTTERNAQPIPYEQRTDGRNYYIKLHKMNVDAFRSYIKMGEIGQHHHEQKQNWLYKEFCTARNKIGYAQPFDRFDHQPRIWVVNGHPNTWWRINGVVTKEHEVPGGLYGVFFYKGEENSMAYDYYERADSKDKHYWRVPNLREAAILSMAFPKSWFMSKGDEQYEGSITTGTTSTNLGPQSTRIPYFDVRCGTVGRMQNDDGYIVNNNTIKQYVRGVHDVR